MAEWYLKYKDNEESAIIQSDRNVYGNILLQVEIKKNFTKEVTFGGFWKVSRVRAEVRAERLKGFENYIAK